MSDAAMAALSSSSHRFVAWRSAASPGFYLHPLSDYRALAARLGAPPTTGAMTIDLCLRVGCRRVVGGRLDEASDDRRLAQRQPLGLLAEPGEAGRAYAFEIAAIGRQRKVEFEDLVLVQTPLELKRAPALDDLRAERARARLEQPRGLHGQGRGAGDDAARARGGEGGPQNRQRIDAGMIVETGRGDGGKHLYFSLPDAVPLVTHLKEYQGIDLKSSGYTVGPGSLHASGGRYRIVYGGPDDIEPAPQALIDLLRKPERHRAEYDGRSVDVSHADIADMLAHIDPDCPYDQWIRIGMAVHHSTGGTGLAIWDAWSARGDKYQGGKMEAHWHSFGRSANPATLGTIIHFAEAGGWVWPVSFGTPGRAAARDRRDCQRKQPRDGRL